MRSPEAAAAGAAPLDRNALALVEAATGHRFADHDRVRRALTHASANSAGGRDYERLEFLGDRVLGLCVAEMVFSEFGEAEEGELSVRLNALVNAETLASVADEIGLGTVIRTGADIEDVRSARLRSVRADVVEALIAALYLDGGLDAARGFIRRHWSDRARHATAARRDAKTELQEWAHRHHAVTPAYRVVERRGPDHAPSFTVEVTVADLAAERAQGGSKRQAEQGAAARMLVREAVWAGESEAGA